MRGEKNAESAGEVPSAGALIVRAAASQPERKASARSCLPGSFTVLPTMEPGGTPAGGAQHPALRARWSLFRPVRMRRF